MKNVYSIQPVMAQPLLFGSVVQADSDVIKVRTQEGLVSAKLSASCLLEPQNGDRVQLMLDQSTHYLVAVLERGSSDSSVLSVPGSLAVKAKEIAFEADTSVSVKAREYSLTAGVASFKVGVMNQLAHKLNLMAERLDMTAKRLHRQASRETVLVEQQHERVAESKHSHFGRWYQRVQKQWVARSERTTITSQKEIKVDGSRIDLG